MKRCNLILLFLDRLDGKEELQLLINKLNKEMDLLDGSVIVEQRFKNGNTSTNSL